jgi:Ca2+/Na+ antiporter
MTNCLIIDLSLFILNAFSDILNASLMCISDERRLQRAIAGAVFTFCCCIYLAACYVYGHRDELWPPNEQKDNENKEEQASSSAASEDSTPSEDSTQEPDSSSIPEPLEHNNQIVDSLDFTELLTNIITWLLIISIPICILIACYFFIRWADKKNTQFESWLKSKRANK